MKESKIAEVLGLTPEELEEMGIDSADILEDTGSSGEMVYSYFIMVPENTPQHILGNKGWSIGDRVELPPHLFDEPDQE